MNDNTRGIAIEDSHHEEERQAPEAHVGQVHSATIQAGDWHAIGTMSQIQYRELSIKTSSRAVLEQSYSSP